MIMAPHPLLPVLPPMLWYGMALLDDRNQGCDVGYGILHVPTVGVAILNAN